MDKRYDWAIPEKFRENDVEYGNILDEQVNFICFF